MRLGRMFSRVGCRWLMLCTSDSDRPNTAITPTDVRAQTRKHEVVAPRTHRWRQCELTQTSPSCPALNLDRPSCPMLGADNMHMGSHYLDGLPIIPVMHATSATVSSRRLVLTSSQLLQPDSYCAHVSAGKSGCRCHYATHAISAAVEDSLESIQPGCKGVRAEGQQRGRLFDDIVQPVCCWTRQCLQEGVSQRDHNLGSKSKG